MAWKTLRELLGQRKANGRTGPLRVALHSHQHVVDEEADIDLDWTPYFQNGLPAPDIWAGVLFPALRHVKKAITNSVGTPELFLPFGVHLSMGLALGFVFRQPTRFRFIIRQDSQTWSTWVDPASRENVPELKYDREQLDVDDPQSNDMALGLSLRHDVRSYLDQVTGVRLKRNIMPPGGPGRDSVPDGNHALWWAHQIADRIGDLRAEHRIETIHLYFTMPFGMTVMLGWLLNALGPIQVHQWDQEAREYRAAYRLIR